MSEPDPDPCGEYPPNPHLGTPSLVKWGSENVGDNTNIKVPFVEKDIEYVRGYFSPEGDDSEEGAGTDRWIEKEIWTLNGEIYDCKGYEKIIAAQDTIRGIFSSDWQTLQVGGGGEGALEVLYYGRVVSISFGESDYVDDVPYSVVIEGYRNANDLAASRAVVDPVASYTWTEAEDATMELRYEVSANGIVTSDSENNALENAKEFVFEYLSADNKMFEWEGKDFNPYIVYHENNYGKRYLVSDEEKIDRVAGSFGIIRVYKIDQTQGEYSSILRYTTDSAFKFGEIKRLTFSGSIEIGYKGNVNADVAPDPDVNLAELRERYYNFKKENLIDPDNKDKLSPKNILSEKIDEDRLGGIFNFTIVFGEPEACIDDYDVTIDDTAESSLIKVTISGQAKYRGPCDFDELKKCFYGYEYYSCAEKTEIVRQKYYDIAYEYYRIFGKDNIEIDSEAFTVNTMPLSLSINEDPTNKLINYTIVFDDRKSYGAQSFDYTISITPPVQQVIVNPFQEIAVDEEDGDKQSCGAATPPKSHHYQDLGIARAGTVSAKLTVVGSAEGDPFDIIKQKAIKSLGSTDTILLTKKIKGGDQTDECSEYSQAGKNYQTHDASWIWQVEGTNNVVNSNSSNRTEIKKLHFGLN